ncbi:hypothetical protein [Candidatus Terasakiella magnetica]|nr:hypothetical protein [Candidatus Terasakiella magnetica]
MDEVASLFSDTAKEIISRHYDVYSLDSNYQRLLNGDSVRGTYGLQFFSILRPSIFGSQEAKEYLDDDGNHSKHVDQFKTITVMGACLKDSLMYYLWDAKFEPHEEITKGLRYDKHDCGDRVQIRYLLKDRWSKHLRDSLHEVGDAKLTTLELLVTAIKSEFDDTGFVYMVNKDREDRVRADLTKHNGEQLPNSPYGLNEYQHLHQAVVLSALNTTPTHFKFLEMMGVDGDSVTESMYFQSCYQAIMRTSLRNPTATEKVKIIVGDEPAALFLQDLFTGAEVSDIITGAKAIEKRRPGRPTKSSTKSRADITKENKLRTKKLKQLEDKIVNGEHVDPIDVQVTLLKAGPQSKKAGDLRAKYDSSLLKPNEATRKIAVPLFESIYKSSAEDLIDIDVGQVDEFINLLEDISKRKLHDKHANLLISTTEFDETASPDTNRGLENFVKAWGIWLDLDGGELPPKELAEILPDTRMVTFNSWSDGNYRVFIPTTKFMSMDSYKEIVQTIIHLVEQSAPDQEHLDAKREGRKPRFYVSGKQAAKQKQRGLTPNPIHGIDLSKVTPTSMFYLPCACTNNPDWSFFKDYNEVPRQTLEPTFWVENSILPQPSPEPLFQRIESEEFRKMAKETANDNEPCNQQEVIEEAMNAYRAIPDGDNRHNAFFHAMWQIHFRGRIPTHDLEQYMIECDYDNHQKKRYSKIKQDLASGKYGTWAA